MPKRVAVITDATSPGFYFPKWHIYYSGAFGAASLYVVTYVGLRESFRTFGLGGLGEVPHHYNDPLRAKLISSLVSSLLLTHDVVVRCDIDEFLVPDPRKFKSFEDYVERLSLPYVTARGIDILENRTDALLDVGKSILFS